MTTRRHTRPQRHRLTLSAVFAALLLVLISPASRSVHAQGATDAVTGRLSFVWGDPFDNEGPRYVVMLTESSGSMRSFAVDAQNAALVAQLRAADGETVELQIDRVLPGLRADGEAAPYPRVRGMRVAGGGRLFSAATEPMAARAMAHGGQVNDAAPWTITRRAYAVVMCKFADVDSEPYTREELQRMYLGGRGSAADYYREASRGRLSIEGTTVTPWVRLPKPRAGYLNGDDARLDLMTTDCLGAADDQVDYRQYSGIGMHFNGAVGCCSWGGGTTVTYDGPPRNMPTMWNMEWARAGTIWHEMGHSFGLPHSGGPYYATYDSRWDVMSFSSGGLYFDPLLRSGGGHFVGWHKDRLGLIPDSSRAEVTGASWRGLVSPHNTGNGPGTQYVVIPLAGGTPGALLTVEARRRSGYDLNLPGEGVVLVTVDPSRAEPAHVVDVDGNGNVNDRGAVWRVGQRYVDPSGGVTVTIDSQTVNGWWVSVQRQNSAAPTPAFEKTGMSYPLARADEVVRDSVRVVAAGAWTVRTVGVPGWLRLDRTSGTGSGWLSYAIVGGLFTAGRAVVTLTFQLPAAQTSPTFRIETGIASPSPDLVLLSRPSRRLSATVGTFWSPFDTVAVRLTGVWANAAWSVTPPERQYVFGPNNTRLTQVDRVGPSALGYVTAIGTSPVGTVLIDTMRFTVRGPTTVQLMVIDTTLVVAPATATNWAIGPRRSAITVPLGARVLDSVLITGPTSGAWTASTRRPDARLRLREGIAGDWLVWSRQPTAEGVSVDTISVFPTGQSSLSIVDTLRGVDVPLRLSATRTGASATAVPAQTSRFDSTTVFILGSAGSTLRWRASSGAPSLRVLFNGAFVPQASGATGDPLRWSRDISGLPPGRYIDTINVSVSGAANSPLRIVDTTTVVAPPQTVGDVDNDGSISAADGLMILRWLVQLPLAPRADVSRTGDVNCDGQVTVADALLLFQVDAGLLPGAGCIGRPR